MSETNFDKVAAPGGVRAGDADLNEAELETLDTVTPGTSTANKAAVLGANKNLDVLALPVSGLKIGAGAGTAVDRTAAELNLLAQGVAAGYKVARGQHTQVAASDTVVTGLATVVAVIVSFDSAPTVKQLFCAGQIGNQSGAPAAGSILIKTFKPTAVNDVTPIPATDFTDNLVISWVAIGT